MNIVIEAKRREIGRTSLVKQMRNEGRLPAVIYSRGQESIPISLDEAAFAIEYHKSIGEISFFIVKLDGKEYKTVIREKQIHPVTRRNRHIDFQELIPGEFITFEIPVQYVGEPHGLKEGGKLEILVRKIKITCKPEDVPDEVVVDLAPMGMGSSIHFSDLKLENIKSKIPDNTVLVQVKGARVGK
jgi:large subunit ribosomal protein L25